MPVRDLKGKQVWQRRNGRESLVHWVMWLLGVAVSRPRVLRLRC